MKCSKCGKEIQEHETFCNICKKDLRKSSSRGDVRELEELIEEQKKLTDLENTKELENLHNLIEEELENFNDSIAIQNLEIKREINEKDKEEIKNKSKKSKNNKKKLVIIISIIFSILIILLMILLMFFDKNQDQETEEIIDYKKVINTYGNLITDIVKEYMVSNETIPTWQYINEILNYDRYEVICNNKNIYSNGTIYLSECEINNKKIEYTYGIELEEIKELKKINIYKKEYEGSIIYSNEGSILESSITCKTEDCEYISAYNKYVLIKEKDELYLYDYTNDSITFGPFTKNDYSILAENNNLYGIFYKEENRNNIYNVNTGKVLKDIKGTLLNLDMNIDPTIMYKYNYVTLSNKGKNEFVNLKTGNVSYIIEETISSFMEDYNKKIVYITAYKNNPNTFKIYNSNGKSLFEGKEYSCFIIGNNNLLIGTDTNFKVYDKNLKLKTKSKNYDYILKLCEDFIVAVQNNNVILLNIEDEILATFEDAWDNDNSIFYNNLSGTDKDKIYITIENKKILHGTKGKYIEYYYIPSIEQSGYIEKSSIN